jgi:translation initiation factor 2 alpha subunit (eIF-2alpha)
MLPASEHFVEFMKELKSEITVFGGEAVLARFSFMDESDNQNAIEKFNLGLSREYNDIYDTVSKIRNELENIRKSNLLSLAYLDERLSLIIKLKKNYEKIKVRDYFKVRLHERIGEQIDFLLQTVQRYHAEFYTNSN